MLPIVFIHKGNSWYLPYTLWQCRMMNPVNDIYLIGDENSRGLARGDIMHVNIHQYGKAIKLLDEVYVHKSNLGASFELACIERWFILAEFLRRNQIRQCVYLDSDILVYEDLSKYPSLFSGYSMTWCSFSAHVNFVMSVAALHNYCKLVTDLFEGKEDRKFMYQSLFERIFRNESDLNISDMSFFYDYNEKFPYSLLAVNVLKPGISLFDITMEDTSLFENEGEFKKISWQGNRPFVTLKSDGSTVPMAVLHFQGKAKPLIPTFFRFPSARFRLYKWQNDIYIMKMALISRLKRILKKA